MYIEENEEVIIYLIMEEFGGIRFKVVFEIGFVKNIMKEVVMFFVCMEGKIFLLIIDGKENRLYCVLVGVVGVISLFNFLFFLFMKLVVFVFGVGNGVVLKLYEEILICGGILIVKIFENVGILEGLLNVVVIDIVEIGDSFVEYLVLWIILFIGFMKVGSYIGQFVMKYFKKLFFEFGGNSVFIVFEDVDIEYVVNVVVFSRFIY